MEGDSAYSGYFHTLLSPHVAVRLGFRDPTSGTDPGLSLTDITSAAASTSWTSVPLGPKHDFYVSVTAFNGSFISLAPRSGGGPLDLFSWNVGGSAALLGSLDDAHEVPYFGPLAESANTARGIYIAGLVHNGLSTRQDRWAIAVAQMHPLNVTSIVLEPKLTAEIDSIAGIGIPNL